MSIMIAFFVIFEGIEDLCAGPERKLENYESVLHRLTFSAIKQGAKISFQTGHFN